MCVCVGMGGSVFIIISNNVCVSWKGRVCVRNND